MRTRAACDLHIGDVVIEGDLRLEVLEEPLTMHRGNGPFDAFELLVGVRIATGAGPGVLRVWSVDDLLPIERPAERLSA